MRITNQALDFAVDRYASIMRSQGVTRKIELQRGSKTYGNAYRLYFIGDADGNGTGTTGVYGTENGYLGMTKREAYDTLYIIVRAMGDLLYFQEQRNASL